MWLLLAGLTTLLTGDVLSQANNVIYNETDLLALPSDQLIHSSAELLALEDQFTGLPFGAKLPGYEKPLFAYSYTIKDSAGSNHPVSPPVQTHHKIHEQLGTQTSQNVIYLDNTHHWRSHGAPFVPVINQQSRNNVEKNRKSQTKTTKSDNTETRLPEPTKQTNIVHMAPLKFQEREENNLHLKLNSNKYSSETTLPLLHMTLKPPFDKHVHKLQTLPLGNSPQTQESKEVSPATLNLSLDYLPPDNGPHKSTLETEYLPPKENAPAIHSLNLDYLPPYEKSTPQTLNLDYLPPDEKLSPQTLNLDYLPPDENPLPQTLNLDYLSPDENPLPETLNIESDNNPTPQTLNLDYLPPNEKTSPQTLNLDYLPPDDLPELQPLNLDYLPPDENLSDAKLNADHDTSNSGPTDLSIDFVSPPVTNSNIQYISPLRKDTSFVPIPPKGIIRTLVPPVVEFRHNVVNDPITPVKGKKEALVVVGEFKKKEIHQRWQGINKLKPLPVHSGFVNEPISHISEATETIPFSTIVNTEPKHGITFTTFKSRPVTSGFVNEPIILVKETKAAEPLSVIANIEHRTFQSKHDSSKPLSLIRTLIPPIVEFNPVINEAINPIYVKKESPLQAVSESFEHKKVVSTQHMNAHKSQTFRNQFKSTQFREVLNEPIIPVTGTREASRPVVVIGNIKHSKPSIGLHSLNRKPGSSLIGVTRELNEINQVPITEARNDPLVVKVEHSESLPYALFYKHSNIPIRPISKRPSTLAAVADLNESVVKPTTKKKIVRPERHFKEIINEPISLTAERPNITPHAVVGEKAANRIELRKPNKPVSPHVEFNNYKDQPIQPSRGKNPSAPFSIVSTQNRRNYKQKVNVPPTAVVSLKLQNKPVHPQSHYTKTPLSVTYEGNIKIAALKERNTNTIVQSETPYQCLSNDECNEKDICQEGKCVLGCSIAKHLCIGKAVCETRHHVPACVCPRSFTARTVRTSSLTQFDCTPMVISQSSNNIIGHIRRQTTSRYSSSSYQRPIIAPIRSSSFEDTTSFSRPVTAASFHSAIDRRSACSPSPCGDNTQCSVNQNGVALCRCEEGYVPEGNTIRGCKPQCIGDSECPDDYRCTRNKCARVCVPGACGLSADCTARSHVARCSCPPGYGGSPENRCNRNIPEIRAPADLPVDLCHPSPCGTSADCRERGDRPVCSCPRGYEGNPLERCIKGECVAHEDCPDRLACSSLRCIDPCIGVCGSSAECSVRNHQPVCSCPPNNIGDPFTSCRRITERDICTPTPCGTGTNCRAKTDRSTGSMRAVCSCVDNYIGNPLTQCRPECTRDTDCDSNKECQNNRCRNPCVDGCGTGAYCDVRNHRAVCTCPEFFKGDPHSNCYPECTTHEECPGYQACYKFECIDPCQLPGTCGSGADCKVEDHTPICSCPRGYTGDPFISCRAFTREDLCADNPCGTEAECHPGTDRSGNDRPVCTCPVGYIGNPLVRCQRGDCEHHDTCPDHQACYGYICQSPCYSDVGSVCGENAQCNVKNHQPVCSCPRGYTGNPIEGCRVAPNARIAGRSHRKQ